MAAVVASVLKHTKTMEHLSMNKILCDPAQHCNAILTLSFIITMGIQLELT